MYKITQKFISKNRSYKALNPIGIVIHETANPGDSDEMEFSYFNNNSVNASAHAFVDADSITQMIPWNEIGWHAGHTANYKFLGIEMCHATTKEKFNETWNKTVWLFAYLFINVVKCTTITKDNLMSHAEVSNKWKETDHQDPVSYFAKYGKTVDMFRQAVQAEINKQIVKEVVYMKSWKQEIGEKAIDILASKNLISKPDEWKSKNLEVENTPLWLFFEMLNRLVK